MLDTNKVLTLASWLLWWGLLSVWTVALLIPEPESTCTGGLVSTNPRLGSPIVLSSGVKFSVAKACHIGFYALLGGSLMLLSGNPLLRWGLLAFLALHAGGTEFLQNFVPGRFGSVRDVVLDLVGLTLGLGLTWGRWCWGAALVDLLAWDSQPLPAKAE